MFLDRQVRADDPRLKATYAHFRQNLEDICRVATGSGAKVIACTVPVNLQGCAPFASLHAPNLAPAQLQEWERIYGEGVALGGGGDLDEAARVYRDAARIDDRFAALPFRPGTVRRGARPGRGSRLVWFSAARDLDTLRFRADTTINDTVRRVAAALGSRRRPPGRRRAGVRREQPLGDPGGRPVLRTRPYEFQRQLPARPRGRPEGPRSPAAADPRWRGPTPRSSRSKVARDGWAIPAGNAIGMRRRCTRCSRVRRSPTSSTPTSGRSDGRGNSRGCGPTSGRRPSGGRSPRAGKPCKIAPEDGMIRLHHANLLAELGDGDRAAEQYEAVLKQWPHCFMARYKLAGLLLKRGRFRRGEGRLSRGLADRARFRRAITAWPRCWSPRVGSRKRSPSIPSAWPESPIVWRRSVRRPSSWIGSGGGPRPGPAWRKPSASTRTTP